MINKKRKSSFIFKAVISFSVIVASAGAFWIYNIYKSIYLPNVNLHGQKTSYIYIPTRSTFDDLINILYKNNFLDNKSSFRWVAEKKKLKYNINPGKYLLKTGMNNNDLINMLRSGKQEPVRLVLNSVRTKQQLAEKVSMRIEADSVSILQLLNDETFLEKYRLTKESAMALFIPNTYEFYWNTSAIQFIDRMAKEYVDFWTKERQEKADAISLSRVEVAILASIVHQETAKNDEKPTIAGVYINRLKKGMRLEADPTLVFAMGDFSINRVLNVHKEIESPYNTYKFTGLPPGPICMPSVNSLNSVLNYEKHAYLYFCAREDFSGYHNFAKT